MKKLSLMLLAICFFSILTAQLKAQSSRNKYVSLPKNEISAEFPNTESGEIALFNKINQIESASGELVTYEDLNIAERNAGRNKNAENIAEFKRLTETFNKQKLTVESVRKLRWKFIRRSIHFDKTKLANTYYLLLWDAPYDPQLTDQQLGDIIKGLIAHKHYIKSKSEVYSFISEILVLNKKFHPQSIFNIEAEKYARIAVLETEEKIKSLSEKEVVEKANSMRAEILSSLGYILFEQGKLVEAEETLIKAQSLLPNNSEDLAVRRIITKNNLRLARLYSQKNLFEKAEEYYLKVSVGHPHEWMYFEDLHKARNNGKIEGFEDYFRQISEKISLKLQEAVILTRIKNPQSLVPFELETIEGKKISFSDLKSKVIVINLWGTWCSPCIRELPELQQLYKKYEGDKEVAIITMDADDELENVKKFVAEKKYDFPVLLGDSYKENMKFHGTVTFPTTLFVGKNGKIDYIKIGNSPKLLVEFGWRIDALKEDK